MLFKSVTAYLEALNKDPALAMIPLGMVAEWKGISRSAVSEQIKSGRLEGIVVRGDNKTWRGVSPHTLFAQAEERDSHQRERRMRVLAAIAQAAAEGCLLTYGEVMAPAGMVPSNPRHRAEIGTILSDLSRDSLGSQGFLISALVVQKTSGRPNGLFYTLARELGCLEEDGDETAFWRDQCGRAFAAYRMQVPSLASCSG